jgi:hypothetical protein
VSPAAGADFNGDGKQDMVWRSHGGNAVVWQMNGLAVAARSTLSPALDAGSAIVGSGSFFGSSNPGAIAWVDAGNRLSLWQVSNGSVQQSCIVASAIDPGWNFLGIGDLNGDGIDDVAWRAPDGSVEVYLINGCTTPQTVALAATADAVWTFLGIGDVDTHSDAAIFWRAANGDVILWRLNNGTGILPTTLSAGSYASWAVAAIADFDGDGRTDILWRSGTQTALWLMNGTKVTAATVVAASSTVFAAADDIFAGGFDTSTPRAGPLTSAWTILGASDVTGAGRADIVLANGDGGTAIWQMQGATIQATGLIAPTADMPYTALTGWRMQLDRPTVTKIADQVTVAWAPVAGLPAYTLYASASNYPANGGVPIAVANTSLSFGRSDAGFADKRYFAVGARYLGVQLPSSPEAYIVEFTTTMTPVFGPMAVADINADGCVEILGLIGDCHGAFQVFGVYDLGLSALVAPGRAFRDLRFADFDGDGILDLVSNVYSPLDDTASYALFFRGTGNAQFVEDPDFSNLGIRGYGETIVVADFNNDGFLDIYLPQYSFNSPDEHSWLLVNDGAGHFTDVADIAGVALRGVPSCGRPEGAQAVDLNNDGRIDLFAASHLFLNSSQNANGVPIFTDLGPSSIDSHCNVESASVAGLPQFADEGAKFIDLDNSGQLSLALNGGNWPPGIVIYKFDGLSHFFQVEAVPAIFLNSSWGFAATDIDGDGLSDLVLAGGCDSSFFSGSEIDPNCSTIGNPHALPRLLVNRNGNLVQHDFFQDGLAPEQRGWNDLQAVADFDYSGTADVVSRFGGGLDSGFTVAMNNAVSYDTLTVTVTDAHGAHNQAGRVVRVSPELRPDIIMTQVVDGGSGYMTNGPYDLAFATPYPGAYSVTVRFAGGTFTTKAHSGDHLTMRADGTYSVR